MALKLREWKTSKGEARTAWVVDYYDQNKKRHLKTFTKKKDAQAFQAGTHLEVRDGVHIAERQATSIKQAAANWLASCSDLESSTRAQYRQHVDLHIVPFIGDEKLPTRRFHSSESSSIAFGLATTACRQTTSGAPRVPQLWFAMSGSASARFCPMRRSAATS